MQAVAVVRLQPRRYLLVIIRSQRSNSAVCRLAVDVGGHEQRVALFCFVLCLVDFFLLMKNGVQFLKFLTPAAPQSMVKPKVAADVHRQECKFILLRLGQQLRSQYYRSIVGIVCSQYFDNQPLPVASVIGLLVVCQIAGFGIQRDDRSQQPLSK